MTISSWNKNFFWLPEQGSGPIDALPMREDRWYDVGLLIAVV